MNLEKLLNEIELLMVKKSLDIPPNLVPTITKIVVTKDIWNELEKDRMFRISVQRKPIYRNIERRIKRNKWEREWVKVIPEPNLGGIPLELGDKLDIVVEGKEPVKRKFKQVHSEIYS